MKDVQIQQPIHIPVLCKQVLQYLEFADGQVIVDCTLGLGSHAYEIFHSVGELRTYIGIDQDIQAIRHAKKKLAPFAQKCIFVNQNFRYVAKILEDLGIQRVDRVLFDLGVSSLHLDTPQRGFSFRADGPLDMRMDQTLRMDAAGVVNTFSEQQLARIFYEYGQERKSRRIAKAIVQRRKLQKFSTTQDLAQVIETALGPGARRYKIHPATRSFQALRIWVNDELAAIQQALEQIDPFLATGARIGVISFHSLEDRVVKHIFRNKKQEKQYRLITKKPLFATVEEIRENPRARSARLRVAEKI